MRLLLLLLFLPVAVRADDVYHIRSLSEGQLLDTYTSIMRDACRHSDLFWHDWKSHPGLGYWGSGRSDNMNEGVRAISGMVLTCGSLLKYSDSFKTKERAEYKRKAIAALRYATATHVTGPLKCTDGKHWGNSWQSAMWTADLAFGAWLMWDDMDPGLRKDIERIVAYEADRFLAGKPPAGSFNDTKAEENGWDLTCLAVASVMFPDNPHASEWNEKAIEYMMNTLSAPQDQDDKNIVDGRPVSEWFTGANVHPDFTLENHGFFHPGYVGCSSYFLTQTAMYYTFARKPVPQAADHHLMDTWRMFQGILLPNGEAACPQGMDWELHGLPYDNLFASLATRERDALAARLERIYMQYMRAWQVMCHGDLAAPGSTLGFTRHAICAEQAAYGFLAHKIFGPPVKPLTTGEAAAQIEGVRADDWVQVVTHRTANKFASVSWTNRVMGMLVPIGPGHEANPDFTAPIVGGFFGGFDLASRGKSRTTVLEHSWKTNVNGFETTGTLMLNAGRLIQTVRVISIGEKTVVYEDRVTALEDVTVKIEGGFPIGIENDEITGGSRLVSHQDGHSAFDFRKPRPPLIVSGSWMNVDGRLGVVMARGAGLAYQQAGGYKPGISICEDILYGSLSNHRKHFQAGEEVAHRVAVACVEVTPRETAALAKTVRIEQGPRGSTLHLKLAGGGETEIPLL
jgi:hypothetical protein